MTMPAMISAAAPEALPLLMVEHTARFSAGEIREAISHWVTQDRLDLADALVAAGLSQYPDTQDILVAAALVAEVQQDWAQAQSRLEALIEAQARCVTAETLYQYIRVLRCRGAFFNAYLRAREAVRGFPHHPGLAQAHAELEALMESVRMSAVEANTAR